MTKLKLYLQVKYAGGMKPHVAYFPWEDEGAEEGADNLIRSTASLGKSILCFIIFLISSSLISEGNNELLV